MINLKSRAMGFPQRACFLNAYLKTRMHPSRMRTARSLTACRSICGGGGVGVHGRGDMHGRGCVWKGGVPRGHAWPPVNRMTDACENITLPQTSFAGGNNPIFG